MYYLVRVSMNLYKGTNIPLKKLMTSSCPKDYLQMLPCCGLGFNKWIRRAHKSICRGVVWLFILIWNGFLSWAYIWWRSGKDVWDKKVVTYMHLNPYIISGPWNCMFKSPLFPDHWINGLLRYYSEHQEWLTQMPFGLSIMTFLTKLQAITATCFAEKAHCFLPLSPLHGSSGPTDLTYLSFVFGESLQQWKLEEVQNPSLTHSSLWEETRSFTSFHEAKDCEHPQCTAVCRTAFTEDICSSHKCWQHWKLFIPSFARHCSGACTLGSC